MENYQHVLDLLQEEISNSSLLGTMLGVGTVKIPDQLSCADYMSMVLDNWEKQSANCTWEVLRKALKSCGYIALEAQLEKDGRTGPSKIL